MNADFRTEHLGPKARKIAKAIVAYIQQAKGRPPSGGGCRAFYTPEEWRERGEQYGLSSVLVLCHDGGDLMSYCNMDVGGHQTTEPFSAMLEAMGYFVETCTGWYSAVYLRE